MMQDLPPRSSTDAYRVRLDHFQGPLDLLLYLVRRQEVNILDIPIARIAEQFLDFLQALQALDLDGIGEFLVMAGTLMEIKSRMLLPAMEREDGESEDPRVELVRQLVEYRRYKEAAQLLEERARDRARCLPRPAAAWNEQSDERTPEQVEIWDLVSAFGRLLRQAETPVVSELPEDQPPFTPCHGGYPRCGPAARTGRVCRCFSAPAHAAETSQHVHRFVGAGAPRAATCGADRAFRCHLDHRRRSVARQCQRTARRQRLTAETRTRAKGQPPGRRRHRRVTRRASVVCVSAA